MYQSFINKDIKLVYNDGVKQDKCLTRYVKGKVIDANKKSLTIKLLESNKLFAVSLAQIVYVKELGIGDSEKRNGG